MIALEGEADARMRDRETPDDLRNRLRFGAVALQELQARRRGGEKVRDLDARARRRRGRTDRPLRTRLDEDRRAGLGVRRARRDRKPRHGSDRGQGLAPEAERRDGEKIAVRELRGGVALDREFEILGAHAAPVVDDPDQPAPSRRDGDRNRAGAGIERVLDELLHGRGRTLDHFARRDAVDEDGIEAADGCHEACESGVRTGPG